MKNILKYAVGCFAAVTIIACGDIYGIHEEYLKMGEETYIGRADSLKANAGFNRIELKWMLNADPRIKDCTITWNGCETPLIVPAERVDGYMSKIIELPEGKYVFKITVNSDSGKKSLLQTVSGEVYGSNYQASLPQKSIKSMAATPKGVTLTWVPEEGCVRNYLNYVSNTGDKKKLTLPGDVATTFIEDFEPGSEFILSSVFKPEKEAIDEIESLEKTLKFPSYFVISKTDWDATYHAQYADVDYTGWAVEANTQEAGGEGAVNGYATALLDGDLATFWHSAWSNGANPPLPHIISIDMKKQQSIQSVELVRRANNKDTKGVTFSISDDNVSWKELGSFEFPNENNPNAMILLLGQPVTGRYLRTTVTSSNNGINASIAEILFTSNKK